MVSCQCMPQGNRTSWKSRFKRNSIETIYNKTRLNLSLVLSALKTSAVQFLDRYIDYDNVAFNCI